MQPGTCRHCWRHGVLVGPLYNERGGPLVCIQCGTEWHAKYSRRRRYGRIVVKALKAFFEAGGKWGDVDRLKIRAQGMDIFSDSEDDKIGADVGDITSELLDAAVRLTHPDRHPPERQADASYVTKELLALKPYVFPAPKPKPAPPPRRDRSADARDETSKKAFAEMKGYPCPLCIDQFPGDYCDPCKAEWIKRNEQQNERERKRRRDLYRAKKQLERSIAPPVVCQQCGTEFKGKRKGAKYCSAACRQSAYRANVTDSCPSQRSRLEKRNAARTR
jgi:hypothetical protein